MAYSELIKNFERIRDYMREFYVYGFKSRDEYSVKSTRSYDNEKRRMESWLGDYMSFRQDASGKSVFLSVDSRNIIFNPLHKAFKAKSFTDYDIMLHFYILDILSDGKALGVHEIIDAVADYLFEAGSDIVLDDSTIRKKLREYEQLGMLVSEKCGRELKYRTCESDVDEENWKDAVTFMSEEDPMGVIGSYCLDRYDEIPDYLRHKHHYILSALDSEVLYELLIAIKEHKVAEISIYCKRREKNKDFTVYPVRIYSSTQSGRSYLLSYAYELGKFIFVRLDSIHKIKTGEKEKNPEKYEALYQKYKDSLWGVSVGKKLSGEHVELTIHVSEGEEFIIRRLKREKRCGIVEKLDDHSYRFSANVYDSGEMLPWVRTFIGRIISFKSSNKAVEERFYNDLMTMKEMYGGDGGDVQ